MSAMPAGDPRRPSRNGKGRFTRDLAHAERDGRACLLISQGHTYEEVARELGYTDKGACWRAVQATLAETAAASGAAVLREQQLRELAELRRKMWQIIENSPPLVDRLGRPVTDGEDGDPVPDAHAQVEAAAAIIRANDRIAKLRGPQRSIPAMPSRRRRIGWRRARRSTSMAPGPATGR